jgi:hypothetical protein
MRAWRHRWNYRSGGCPRPECDLGTAGRPQLPSRDALAGLSLLLRDELPPLQTGRSPAVHRMQMSACSTTDQSGAVGWCSNHRARTAGGCRMQLDGYDVGRMHSWWQGHRVGCGGAGDSAGRRPEPGGGAACRIGIVRRLGWRENHARTARLRMRPRVRASHDASWNRTCRGTSSWAESW